MASFYRAIEAGDRSGVAAVCAPSLRVEGFVDGAWTIWDRDTYLDRVASVRALVGEDPRGTVQSTDIQDGHGRVTATLRWSTGGFADSLLFAREDDCWTLRHKTFREVAGVTPQGSTG